MRFPKIDVPKLTLVEYGMGAAILGGAALAAYLLTRKPKPPPGNCYFVARDATTEADDASPGQVVQIPSGTRLQAQNITYGNTSPFRAILPDGRAVMVAPGWEAKYDLEGCSV